MTRKDKEIVLESLRMSYVTKNEEYKGIRQLAIALIGKTEIVQFEISIDLGCNWNDYINLLEEAKRNSIDCYCMPYDAAIEYIYEESAYTDNEATLKQLCDNLKAKINISNSIKQDLLKQVDRMIS